MFIKVLRNALDWKHVTVFGKYREKLIFTEDS